MVKNGKMQAYKKFTKENIYEQSKTFNHRQQQGVCTTT